MDEATPVTTPEQVSQAEIQDKIVEEWASKATAELLKDAVDPQPTEPAKIQEAEDNQAQAEKNKLEAEAAKTKAEAEAKEAEKKEPNPAGVIGKARRLLADGDVKGAIKLTLGVDLEQVELSGKQWRAIKYHAVEREKEAEEAKSQAAQEVAQAQKVVQTLDPFIKGAQAYLVGDFETFLKLTTGDTPEEFQRKMINQLHSGDKKGSDPALLAKLEQIERERQQERAQAAEERRRWEEAQKRQQYEQAVANWKSEVVNELQSSPYAKMANKPAFVEKIFALQEAHYNPRTKETIGTIDAAEMVWDELYGDVVPVPAGGTSPTVATTAKVANTQRSVDKSEVPTTVKHTQTNEAAPSPSHAWSPDNQDKIMTEWIRKAQSEALQASLSSS